MPPKKGAANRGTTNKKILADIPDSDYIVFGDGKKDKKKKKASTEADSEIPVPNKPTVKQLIGGASWTGKLPVNLLSEHCQRQKWNKPDYDMHTLPPRDGGEKMYRSSVTLSKTDPKTREMVKLPPFRLPQDHVHLSEQASALEARHFAATYALFRISSMKNVHMTLPPQFRDLWKGAFTQLKKTDVSDGRAWRYDEDPFAAETKRQEIQKSIEKRAAEQLKKQEQELSSHQSIFPGLRGRKSTKAWDDAPQVEMGAQMRTEIEELIRGRVTWNPNEVNIPVSEHEAISAEMKALGFRISHIEEALEYCKDREEVLEWLIIHIPEDDLPKWALPSNYSTGLSLASGDLVKEAKLKRLARAGYPTDMCAICLQRSDGSEALAARLLQSNLVPEADMATVLNADSPSIWVEEMQTLESIFGENYSATEDGGCTIRIECIDGRQLSLRFGCPTEAYPSSEVLVVSIEADDLPAYIRLSATRQAILHARDVFLGEVMVYNICQWVETALPEIVKNPGRLSELQQVTLQDPMSIKEISGKGKMTTEHGRRGRYKRRAIQDERDGEGIFKLRETRNETSAQKHMLTARQKLPAWTKQKSIIETVQRNQVTIVSGETGSGKSTQTVQFLLDNAIDHMQGATTNILCTQPRRVATLSLADRVSNERCSQVGDEVGYVIRGESKVSPNTKVTFMTTGVLLRRLQNAQSIADGLTGVSHVVIDEVHERSLDTDFLLALLKDHIATHPKLKVLLMSATLDAEIFTSYFGGPSNVGVVHIEGRTFPVNDLYLDDVLLSTRYAGLEREENVGKAIQSLGTGINYDLIRTLIEYIDGKLENAIGSILVFVSGTYEIDRCLGKVGSLPRVYGLPLHASLVPAEQRRVFLPAPGGKRKVIVATNVAETSITIEDIVAVIDTGRVKETSYDATNNIQRLEEGWASQAACKQRRGRAGRLRAGDCYKLFTRQTEMQMPAKPLPEISRVPLEQLCLSVKATGTNRDIAAFLSNTLTPPSAGAVSNAIQSLHIMGALENNELTALGQYLATIPADLRCAKLLVYGSLFDCLEPCLTIASILTARSPFVSPKDKREEATEARHSFLTIHGDLLLDVAAFDEWTDLSHRLRSRELNDWCSSKFLSHQTLRDIASGRIQLLDSLKGAGLVPVAYKSPRVQASVRDANDQSLLLRALIAGSLQPQIAMIQMPQKKYIASLSGAKELDPEARTIKFFIPDPSQADEIGLADSVRRIGLGSQPSSDSSLIGSSQTPNPGMDSQFIRLTRVFLHPSTSLFTAQSFSHHATHLSYFTKVQTSKPFIRDVTPLNIYSLLLFGGRLEIDTSGLGLCVASAWRIRGWARIGVLINRLRALLDEELRTAIEEEGTAMEPGESLMGTLKDSKVVILVRKLIQLNGQDK